MHYRFRWVYCFRQEEFAKIYFFLPTTAHRNYLQKMHFVFSQTYESNLPFCLPFAGVLEPAIDSRGRSSSGATMPRSARRFLS
jgi:hypothetical protein